MLIFSNHPLETDVLNVNLAPLLTAPSIKIRVINTAVNNDVKIPIINVKANPLIGPVPKHIK